MYKHVVLWSDNYDGEIMTYESYLKIKTRFSSGDFATHIVLPYIGKVNTFFGEIINKNIEQNYFDVPF